MMTTTKYDKDDNIDDDDDADDEEEEGKGVGLKRSGVYIIIVRISPVIFFTELEISSVEPCI